MRRVLIADDSSTARMFVRRCMEIAGLREAEFVEVGDGKEALDALEKGRFDLLLTDLTMPNMDGSELLKTVRGRAEWKTMPIMVITSAKNPAREALLIAWGANAVFAKPVSPSMMAKALQLIEANEKGQNS